VGVRREPLERDMPGGVSGGRVACVEPGDGWVACFTHPQRGDQRQV